MLNEMLRLLEDGGIHSTAELARRLGVSDGLVAAMAADLARRGYLTALDSGCSAKCDGCASAALCAMQDRAAVLALTAKGREAAQA